MNLTLVSGRLPSLLLQDSPASSQGLRKLQTLTSQGEDYVYTTQSKPQSGFTSTARVLGIPASVTALAGAAGNADEIAIWNFNDSDLVVDHGTGTLTTNFNLANVLFTSAGTGTNARQGDAAGQSMTLQGGTSNANNGRTLNLNVSTVGLNNIVISFATQRTSTGFNSNQFQYSLDGVAFINFGAPYTPPLTFGLVTFDLSSISGVNDNPNAAFRIVFNGATSASGNNRIDNLVVEGQNITTPIPEPTSILLLSLGLTGTLATRFKAWRRKPGRRRD